MSRTRKGRKPIGWEPWGNIREKEMERLKSLEAEMWPEPREPDAICPGCPLCVCVKCGGHIARGATELDFKCIKCGHKPEGS